MGNVRRLAVIYCNAGGGHRSAARAIKEVIEQTTAWQVELVNLQHVLERIDLLHTFTGIYIEDLYNATLRGGLRSANRILTPLLRGGIIPIYQQKIARLLAQEWDVMAPDMVISVISLFNRPIWCSAKEAGVRLFVTIMVDLADCPPHFWLERQEQYLIVSSRKALEQALAMGHSRDRVFETLGPPLHPRFHALATELDPSERLSQRAQDGLDERFTGLVSFGANGSSEMVSIARRLSRLGDRVQLVFVCGHGDRLRRKLEPICRDHSWHALGFTDRIPHYMELSDFFVGKGGGLSICEAVHMNLPVITDLGWRTMMQERHQAEWIREVGAGLLVESFRRIDRAVEALLDPDLFGQLKHNAKGIQMRATAEIPFMLQEIFSRESSETGL